jgi:hypothetical protein
MTGRKRIALSACALFLFAAPPQADANDLVDRSPVVVAGSRFAPRLPGDCPTCYKGHDFGTDCFQYVWTGFEQVWTNVCLWGWR